MEEIEEKNQDITPSKNNNRASKIISLVFMFIFIMVIGFCVQFRIRYDMRFVVGQSMQPTFNTNLEDTDTVYVNKYAKIKQGDITVLYSNALKEFIIKRCVAVGGQTINIVGQNKIGEITYREGQGHNIHLNAYEKYFLEVDGKIVNENYIINSSDVKTMESEFNHFCYYKFNNRIYSEADVEKSITLKENEIFALGDNRLNSTDSSTVGPFNQSEIIGRVDFVIKDGTKPILEYLQKIKFMFIIKI